MKRMFVIIVCIMGISLFLAAETGRDITNNVSAPTGYTLNKGEFEIGVTNVGYGISDRVQIGTNVLYYLSKTLNANIRLNLIKKKKSAFALGVAVQTYKLDMISYVDGIVEDDFRFTAILPFAAFSTKISPDTKLHFVAEYSYFSGREDIDNAVPNANSYGTSATIGIEHSLSKAVKIMAETDYDFEFKGIRTGAAVLRSWKKFRLKLGAQYFKPEGHKGSFCPVIGFWWRFGG
ncbi:MAG: hypothetical protein GY757_54420 [bacterium]|nr:hypothetical protein [bacterium]